MSAEALISEQHFFDREASGLDEQELQIPTPRDVERFRNATLNPRNLVKDALFAEVLPIAGKRVLDYGCGHGENACLLAACGARVTAFDLSPKSIEQATKRAQLHGLADQIQFDVRAAGATEYPAESFDVIAGFGILHHLHTQLPRVFAEIHELLVPGGMAVFTEPVANSALLRLMRRLTPVPCYATPDERQLTDRDFEPMRERFTSMHMRYFDCIGRLRRVTGQRCAVPMAVMDHWLQRILPPLKRCCGQVAVIARK